MNKPTLFLITFNYPYGKDEITFLPQEIEVLNSYFKEILICPLFPEKELAYKASTDNVKIVSIFENYTYSRPKLRPGLVLLVTTIIAREFFFCKRKKEFLKNFTFLVSLFIRDLHKAMLLHKWISDNKIEIKNTIFYSYWLSEGNTILSLIKRRLPELKITGRAHGFDLYEERSEIGFIPFRHLQLKYIDLLFLISDNGMNYASERYGSIIHKFRLSRLGVRNHELGPYRKNAFTIVSCSGVIDLKRVELIARSIMQVKTHPVKWIHFGTGPLMEKLSAAIKHAPANVTIELKGYTPHEDIIQFYKTNSIHLFINLSYYEGIPVSIMEAISFGIPTLATNVGGVKEIVNEKTGILVEKDIDAANVARLIEEFMVSDKNSSAFRDKVRTYWKENFYAENNYSKFAEEITAMVK